MWAQGWRKLKTILEKIGKDAEQVRKECQEALGKIVRLRIARGKNDSSARDIDEVFNLENVIKLI